MVVFSSSSALATSSTTASSFGNEFGGAQRLSDFLFTQEWLQKLSRVALQKVSPSKFEQNLRRSLIQFSAHLKAEATSPMMTKMEATSPAMIKAAGIVRRLARNAASLFRQSLERMVTSESIATPASEENAHPSDFYSPED
jgi:hypothetical protein